MRTRWICALVLLAAVGCDFGHGGHDDPVDARIDAAGAFRCGGAPQACDPEWQYCYYIAAGVSAATDPVIGCNALPTACPSPATCDCVMADISVLTCGGFPSCEVVDGHVQVVCGLP